VGRVQYTEIQCKSAINRVQGMPFKWSLNPYIGCAHSCHYCYARAFYVKADRGNGDDDFETRILVKANLASVLRQQLLKPSWSGESIALGTATDCYQPAEGRFRLTRAAIDVLRERRNPVGMVTKSPMILRDLDLLSELARHAPVRVVFTVTTVDQQLWRTIEPGTANPYQRLAAVRKLNEAGVRAGVLMAPILPGLTDSVASIEAVAAAAAEHGAAFWGATALRLMPTVKEHYLAFVERQFPELLERYERAYPGAYAPRAYIDALNQRLQRVRERHPLGDVSMRFDADGPESAAPADEPGRTPSGQLALPLLA
jgi:DNA repair photolyase